VLRAGENGMIGFWGNTRVEFIDWNNNVIMSSFISVSLIYIPKGNNRQM
jgi:hypothetical protein